MMRFTRSVCSFVGILPTSLTILLFCAVTLAQEPPGQGPNTLAQTCQEHVSACSSVADHPRWALHRSGEAGDSYVDQPVCGPLEKFTGNPKPDDVNSELIGEISGFNVYEVFHDIGPELNHAVGGPRLILVEREPGDFCEIFQDGGGPPAYFIDAGEKLLAITDLELGSAGFRTEAYWTFDSDGPIPLDLTPIAAAVVSALPDGYSAPGPWDFTRDADALGRQFLGNVTKLAFDGTVCDHWNQGRLYDPDAKCGRLHIDFALKDHKLVVAHSEFNELAPVRAVRQPPTPPVGAPPRTSGARNLQAAPLPPVPNDPLELAAAGAQLVQSAEERAAVVALLAKARELSNLRAQPYELKTSFVVSFSGSANGNWTLEDAAPFPALYRWAARGPQYSAVYLYRDDAVYSDQAGGAIPLRLLQVRDAIFFTYPPIAPETQLRTVDGYLDGLELRCILTRQRPAPRGEILPPGRTWDESEYCVDRKSGVLISYSLSPGLYVHYDYSKAFHFYRQIIPSAFTISVDHRAVIAAKIEDVRDPNIASSAQFEPGNLSQVGVGSATATPMHFYGNLRVPANLLSEHARDMVTVHAVLSSVRHVIEAEVLASTNASLNQAALDFADQWNEARLENQPGATPQSREIMFMFTAVPVPQPPAKAPLPEVAVPGGSVPALPAPGALAPQNTDEVSPK